MNGGDLDGGIAGRARSGTWRGNVGVGAGGVCLAGMLGRFGRLVWQLAGLTRLNIDHHHSFAASTVFSLGTFLFCFGWVMEFWI